MTPRVLSTYTYTVSTHGSMDVDGGALAGAVSEDRRYAWIAGGATSGSDPVVLWFVKK